MDEYIKFSAVQSIDETSLNRFIVCELCFRFASLGSVALADKMIWDELFCLEYGARVVVSGRGRRFLREICKCESSGYEHTLILKHFSRILPRLQRPKITEAIQGWEALVEKYKAMFFLNGCYINSCRDWVTAVYDARECNLGRITDYEFACTTEAKDFYDGLFRIEEPLITCIAFH